MVGETREALLDLAARCEAATGPDRELDCRIWSALNGGGFDTYRTVVPDLGQWAALHYTASIDAALTLAPECARLQLSDWDHTLLREQGPWQAILLPAGCRDFGMPPALGRCEHGSTAALAIAAAALRSRTATDALDPPGEVAGNG